MTRQHTQPAAYNAAMDSTFTLTLGRFVHALRAADIEVSPAETLDAFEIIARTGLSDRELVRNALRLALAKTADEKATFDTCFPRFFDGLAVHAPLKQSIVRRIDRDVLEDHVRMLGRENLSTAVALALRGQHTELSLLLAQAVDRNTLDTMQNLRDKAPVVNAAAMSLGLPALDALRSLGGDLATAAAQIRHYLTEQLKSFVDQQYQLVVDASGQRTLLAAALSSNLQQLPPAYHQEVERVVDRLADRLARRHRLRRRRSRRGQLDIRHMLRRNVAFDGAMVHLHWRRQRREKITVYLVCDISNSVSQIARFLLLLIHKLHDVLPRVRSFAFSNRLGEITDLFNQQPHHTAIESAILKFGRGTTDYGHALHDLREVIGKELNRRSVVIFLGDARGNYFPARTDLMRSMARQSGQVWWLTPETSDRWDVGDCVLGEYATACRGVLTVNRLADVERFAERLLEITR